MEYTLNIKGDLAVLLELKELSPKVTSFAWLSKGQPLVRTSEALDDSEVVRLTGYFKRQDHVSDHTALTLAQMKANKNASIDARTQALISNGFAFDGHGFSLSPAAQMNWSGLKTFEAILTWPVKVTANGDVEYPLAQANLIPFVGTALGTVAAHYTSGRVLKLLVNACTTEAQVEAVMDSR